jgi:RNA polymerase sigma-70 factor, ECF subfamily
MNESTLIKKARKGNTDAYGQLYDTYLPAIYRFVFVKVGNKADAEDITHQVFLSAWQNIPKYREQGFPFSSWLYRIAKHTVIDFYRTAKHHTDIDTLPEDLYSELPAFDEAIDRALHMRLAKTFMTKLEDDQQDVLIMKFVNELSNKEIAHAVGKSEGAVRVIQHRALKQLKAYFDEHYGNASDKTSIQAV